MEEQYALMQQEKFRSYNKRENFTVAGETENYL
jgi:hypothetical protein